MSRKSLIVFAISLLMILPAWAAEFPSCPMSELSNLEAWQDRILPIVANKMNVILDNGVEKPTIITEISTDEFSRRHGMPEGTFDATCPCYFPDQNEIYLLPESTLHTLAHELVHYVQVKYMGIPPDRCTDYEEMEAVRIQHWFRREFME